MEEKQKEKLYYIIFYTTIKELKMEAQIVKTCLICKGYGKLPITQLPKAESDGEETAGDCPTCKGKGKLDYNGDGSDRTY